MLIMVYLKLVRMVRNRVLQALQSIDDWRVEADGKLVRVSDGLWVSYESSGKGSHGHYNIGNADHGVAQMIVDWDQELSVAYHEVMNFHPSKNRRRTVLKNLGIEI